MDHQSFNLLNDQRTQLIKEDAHPFVGKLFPYFSENYKDGHTFKEQSVS